MTQLEEPRLAVSTDRPTRVRWVICALLFYATTLNYMDRAIFGVLAKDIQRTVGIDELHYGYINSGFSFAYAIGLLFAGGIIDAIGTRLGYALALVLWSAAGVSTMFMRTPLGIGASRFMLALGESGNFPAAIKTTAEWFPQRERATATGIFNAGSNIGAIAAPLLIPFIVVRHGWPAAFLVTPVFALIWIVLWLSMYRRPSQHPKVNAAELAHIHAGDATAAHPAKSVPWLKILRHRQAYSVMVGKFLTDPVWWFYLYWSGKFFQDRFHTDLKGAALPLVLIYVIADVGSVGGGLLSSKMIDAGYATNVARKTALFVCAFLALPVCMAPLVSNMWVAATLIGVAGAAHQGFSANLMTLSSDLFPRRAVASMTGLGGFCGAVGGILGPLAAGKLLQSSGVAGYFAAFLVAGCMYVVAATLIHVIAPRLTPVQLDEQGPGFPVIPLQP